MTSWRWRSEKSAARDLESKDANIERTRFFKRIVNELRTPINVIMGQIDIALAETGDDSHGHQLRVAVKVAIEGFSKGHRRAEFFPQPGDRVLNFG